MLKQGKFHFHLLFFLVIVFFTGSICAQENSAGFAKYNKRRLGPFTTYFHEAHLVSAYGIDIDYKEKELGNFMPGMNYGLGLGYLFKMKVDDEQQSIGFGIGGEYYPSRYSKFNAGMELLGLGFGKKRWFLSLLITGIDANLIYQSDFREKEMGWTLYMAHLGINNFNVRFGFQTYSEMFIPNMYIDDTFIVLKFSYKYKF
jgi:hypothetical protein